MGQDSGGHVHKIGLRELFEIRLPLHGQELFFCVVTRFAAWHHIAPGTFPAARNRDDVIHGQFFGWRWASAVVTPAFCNSAFPPLGLPELAGFTAFSF